MPFAAVRRPNKSNQNCVASSPSSSSPASTPSSNNINLLSKFTNTTYYIFAPVVLAIFIANIISYQHINAFEQGSARGTGVTPPGLNHAAPRKRLSRNVEAPVTDGAQHVTISPTAEPRLVRVRPPAEQRLYSYLFDSPSAYLKHVRPVIDHATSVKVRLGVCIMTVDDIVEKDQTMLSTGCVKMKWIDEVLRWDPARFDNLTWIVIPSTEIWLPDVALVNSPDPFHMTKKASNVELSYTGEVGYYPSGRFSTRCPVTLTYFPFDAQLCELQFESWAYPVQQLELVAWPVEPVDMKSFVTNHQWLLDGVNVQPLQTFYDGYNFSTVRFHFFFHRRSLYYTVYAVYPCLLMAALQLFSHTLPVEHPGRMALLTSLFIGSSVVQSSITASMPKSSDGVSVIQVYLMLYSGSLLLSIIVTAVNMHIFYRTPDDSAPGIIPLFTSFLLTFGIRPMQKPPSAETGSVKPAVAASSSSRNLPISESNSSTAVSGLRQSSTSATATDGTRRRSSNNRNSYNGSGKMPPPPALTTGGSVPLKKYPPPQSSAVVGLENETVDPRKAYGGNKAATAGPRRPRDEFELIVRASAISTDRVPSNQTAKRIVSPANRDGDNFNVNMLPRESSTSPSVLDLLGDEENSFIDEETPPGSRTSSGYHLSLCTTAVKPMLSNDEPEPHPSPSQTTQSATSSPYGKSVVRSNTTPAMHGPYSSSTNTATPVRNRGKHRGGLAGLLSRASPRKHKHSLANNAAPSRLATFHNNREVAQDWTESSRRWSVAPPPTIFTSGQSPADKMGVAEGVIAEEEADGKEQSELDEIIEAHPADIGMSAMDESMMPADSAAAAAEEQQLIHRRIGAVPSDSSGVIAANKNRASQNENSSMASVNAPAAAEDALKRAKSSGSSTRLEKAEQASRVRIRHAWLTYAAVIDKFFFYTMGVVNFVAPIILFLVMPALQHYPGEGASMPMLPTPDSIK